MKIRALLLCIWSVPCLFSAGTSSSQQVSLHQKMQVPGATLDAGEYTFAVEDRLPDRAIIKVSNDRTNDYQFVLAVPSENLPANGQGLVLFPNPAGDKRILRAWKCPNCTSALQVVYPKDDAVAITGETGKPVMAVDTAYDKLPSKLSDDDRKVVTLWLLSPKEVTSDGKGQGVEAAKYTAPQGVGKTQIASANVAGTATGRRMPHTASNTFTYGLAGLLVTCAGLGLRLQRRYGKA